MLSDEHPQYTPSTPLTHLQCLLAHFTLCELLTMQIPVHPSSKILYFKPTQPISPPPVLRTSKHRLNAVTKEKVMKFRRSTVITIIIGVAYGRLEGS
ncbi:uncharacterized protein LACBIDRAFT_297519 [Laccaria bicolor S238N-H82]|uniref:Predicted protein n=1 Tax=Laccaria bicolor (strain S238N-H82 / ATCC MYA-4686) TaxID=486041 RepID=B0DBD6_LACBS|nr:uncharacterized protein LACBIDRAFT_297519 [Laccaria bicolor S238N-H82]EDR08172.1 predicted protein [Laccaria bicolor S238N-H82]|eukprot:XP_001881242.1 predicted protein [Laccaria bicolor S238N-H82]